MRLKLFACLRFGFGGRNTPRARILFTTPRTGHAYIVKRGEAQTLRIAGYPWFGDWRHDAFIALRGLCISTDRLDEAHDILIQWASAVSESGN